MREVMQNEMVTNIVRDNIPKKTNNEDNWERYNARDEYYKTDNDVQNTS